MNFAYPALVLLLDALPGIIFRKHLSTAGQFRQARTVADEFAPSVAWAIAWHVAWISICQLLPVPTVSLRSALIHATGQYGQNAVYADEAINSVSKFPEYVAAYFLTINFASFCVASAIRTFRQGLWTNENVHKMMRWSSLFKLVDDHEPADQRFKDWAKFFKPEPNDAVVICTLTAIVEYGKSAYLLVGTLIEPVFGPDGNPERFVLRDVMRRPLSSADENNNEATNEDGFHEIRGDSFVLRASEAKTLNIVYNYFRPESDPSSPPETADIAGLPVV